MNPLLSAARSLESKQKHRNNITEDHIELLREVLACNISHRQTVYALKKHNKDKRLISIGGFFYASLIYLFENDRIIFKGKK